MFTPKVMVLDFETALLTGEPSTEYYREDFRAISAAFAWKGADGTTRTKYLEGEDAIGAYLARLAEASIPLVVHNLQFEYGVCAYRFPGTEALVQLDTMRLTQVADNGGREAHWEASVPQTYEQMLDAAADALEDPEEDKPVHKTGLSLVGCASRWLADEFKDHKAPFHALVRERTQCKQGHEGRHLNALTAAENERYNVMDAVVTLELYTRLTSEFETLGYDWRLDHSLYRNSAQLISRSKGLGVGVDREAAAAYRADIQAEVDNVYAAFRERFGEHINKLEAQWVYAWTNALRSDKGREKRRAQIEAEGLPKDLRFKVSSTKHLAALFVDCMGIKPTFFTAESKKSKEKRAKNPDLPPFIPKPSFKAVFLFSYGEGGEMLKTRRKRLLVLAQCDALLALSEYDGKWHLSLKACGTTTGRFAGGNQ